MKMKKHKHMIIMMALMVVLMVVVMIVSVSIASKGLPSNQNVEPDVVTIDINGSIKNIGELATAEYGYKLAQIASKPSKEIAGFKIPFTSSKVIYSYEGMIKAGIKFQDIEVVVNEEDKTIHVNMPDAEILSSEVLFDSLTVYDESYSAVNTLTFSDMNLSLSNLQSEAEKNALEGGLLKRAEENAQNIVCTSIGSLYSLDEYTIEFN